MTKESILLTVLATYIVLITGFSIWLATRIKTANDFLMGSRQIGVTALAGSTLATIIGTGATVGAIGYSYSHGFAGCLYGLGQGVGIIIVGLAFGKMRRYQFMTLGEEIACYYGGSPLIYHFANVTMFLSLVCWIGVQIMGAASYLGILTQLSYVECVIISGLAFACLTIIGGYLAVVYTDLIQAVILLVGFTGLAFLAVSYAGGFSMLREGTPDAYWSVFGVESVGWKSAIAIPLALILSYISEPSYRHRIYSAKSERQALWSMVIPGLLVLPFTFLVAILGMSAQSLNPGLEFQDQALPWLTVAIFPIWATAIVVVSGFAASFSSGNSDAAAGAVFFIRHIFLLLTGNYPKNSLMVTRITIGVMMVVATLLAAQFQTIVDFILVFISALGSGISVVILLGRFWPRATWQGAVGAILTGATITLLVVTMPGLKEFWGQPILPATLGALLIHIVVSLSTPPDPVSFEEVALLMEEERLELETSTAPRLDLSKPQ